MGYKDVAFQVFNLGSGKTVTLCELVSLLEEITGRKPELNRLPSQPADMPETWADISKAQDWLGYRPKTALYDGLREFVSWASLTSREQ